MTVRQELAIVRFVLSGIGFALLAGGVYAAGHYRLAGALIHALR